MRQIVRVRGDNTYLAYIPMWVLVGASPNALRELYVNNSLAVINRNTQKMHASAAKKEIEENHNEKRNSKCYSHLQEMRIPVGAAVGASAVWRSGMPTSNSTSSLYLL